MSDDEPKLRMDAYYYNFKPTGQMAIDKLLSAVACAGKAFHHTNEWNDAAYDGAAPEGHTGSTPVEWIQNAANEAAEALRMGTQINAYVMHGVVRDYKEFKGKFEELEPYMDSAFNGIHHKDGVCVLFDGMGGKFVAVGRVLAKTGNHQPFDEPVVCWPPDDEDELQDAVSAIVGTPVTLRTFVISYHR